MFGIFKRIKEHREVAAYASAIQKELQNEFAEADINFMELHPIMHRAILKDAMNFGVPMATARFQKYAEGLVQMQGSDDEKSELLLDLYRTLDQTL
jgi:hypothetical protein